MSAPKRLLIANRGEIAVRIARSAAEMGIETIAIHPEDDAACLHVRRAGRAILLPGRGAAAYLDADAVLAAAREAGCDAVHPGYGFLSENAAFARAVEAAGLAFVGPTPDSLALFGDKVAAKAQAAALGVPTIPGRDGAATAEEAAAFFETLPEGAAMILKAVSGGGGRGMRVVRSLEEVAEAHARAGSEAKAAFGDSSIYVERFLPAARHLEVQVLGDGSGACIQLGERECSLQRRHQKVIEFAPSPTLGEAERAALCAHALKMAECDAYRSLGTFEFLLDAEAPEGERLYFIEANPRIQVEHTVTEEVLGLDLVRLQLEIAGGATLDELGLDAARAPRPRGFAIQARVNMERIEPDGGARPTGGTVSLYEPPTGGGVRVDGFAQSGYRTSAAYDGLFAKVIVHASAGGFPAAIAKAERALSEFRIEGVETNRDWLRVLLARPEVREGGATTRFIEAEAPALAAAAAALAEAAPTATRAAEPEGARAVIPDGATPVPAPMQATVVSISVANGETVRAGQPIAVLEAMKMEHVVAAPTAGVVRTVFASTGQTLMQNEPLLALEPQEGVGETAEAAKTVDLDAVRPDLRELQDRLAYGLDENRPGAVARRHARGHRTARENLADLCDPGSFNEYGALAVAAQSARRSKQDLIENTSGDGVVTGIGGVNGAQFGPDAARCAFAIYDYMVLAGTQGVRNHKKQDRIFQLAAKWDLPVILFAEGGGGRPGDIVDAGAAGLDVSTFAQFARLSGQVPLVGVVSGRCFAGNAALLGCCDVIIADESANIGMAGPAMIEGGGLGVYPPEAIGPTSMQALNGVVDIRVKDEAEACRVAKQYLSYFQGLLADWTAPDARRLRHAVPENRRRVYDVREAIDALADEGSVLELRREFGDGMVTALIRIEGRPFGLIANNPNHLGGAIDGPAADKGARFMQLCDAHGLPIVSLCDTPGFMVGPEAEKTGLVRHVCRMFVTGASLSVPVFGVVLRKGYGLGAMAMIGGGFHESVSTVAWPTGEFGGMGLEGAVRLGYRRELAAAESPEAEKALFETLLANYYAEGKAVSFGAALEIDAVIDPAETRGWIARAARATPASKKGRRPCVDTW